MDEVGMRIVHLTSSTFFGGPERQMLGLARALAPEHQTTFLSFAEGGRCDAFLNIVREAGFEGERVAADTPHFLRAIRLIAERLVELDADILLCHGYKADLLGRPAARRAKKPVFAVSRGWTHESIKVRLYEALDRLHLRLLDGVVAVSNGQAAKVRKTGVPTEKLSVIRNAARPASFASTSSQGRSALHSCFLSPGEHIVMSAGRLSPEKGYHVLVDAAAAVCRDEPGARFVVFGEGSQREELERRIAAAGLEAHFALPGFRDDLDAIMPNADVFVLPSFTEGLPNVVLEASAAGVPVVATAVGGTTEVVVAGETGLLVTPGDPVGLAAALRQMLADANLRRSFGRAGKDFVRRNFTFEAQAAAYLQLFERVRQSA
jgi:glycosyltransferase involved in cell wall biosynthesis